MGAEPSQQGLLLSVETVGEYLITRGVFDRDRDAIEAHELAGGVSNIVLSARQGALRVVVKKALEKLRVPDQWRAQRERAITEAHALGLVGRLTPHAVPEVLDLDEENCALTIRQSPTGWTNWKQQLLSQRVEPQVATQLGLLLATWHGATRDDRCEAWSSAGSLAFEELRIDPYYLTVASRRPELLGPIEILVAEMRATRSCLVHGDYSPKNVLVGDGLWVIDFEVAHYGDPAFDLAFMLSHLLLKRLHLPQSAEVIGACAEEFLRAYESVPTGIDLDGRYVMAHLGALLAARVDGKSPVEYLSGPERDFARDLGSRFLTDPPDSIAEALTLADPGRMPAQRSSFGEGAR